MAKFYLLPPRSVLAHHFVEYLRKIFPGLDWDIDTRENLTEALEAAATCQPEVFVVYREELPEQGSTYQSLVDAFGAEDGDEIIDIHAGGQPSELIAQRWNIRRAA